MLVIENCRLTWPDFRADYSLSVEAGNLCAVIGPSGGGKTTLLHMIAGFETPESGTLTFNGQNLLPLEPARRPAAIVFQDHNLFPHLTAAQNVALGLRPSLRLKSEE
jgi:thiamine transport system ATP-binding protein